MSSVWNGNLQLSVFGESHGTAVGMVMHGLPAGKPVDEAVLNAFLQRRAPGQDAYASARREEDRAEILSGITDGRTNGAPLAVVIHNRAADRTDYDTLRDTPRPGHADFPAQMKYNGAQDPCGGGHFSGRLTAPLCAAGGICLQFLAEYGISVGAHIASIAGVYDEEWDPALVDAAQLRKLTESTFPVLNAQAGNDMKVAIAEAAAEGDSVGGTIACAVAGLPVGLGEPMFAGMENKIASLVFAIPAVKGIAFGNGFAAASLRGSQNNDAFIQTEHGTRTATNRHGGVLGGLTTGMPLLFEVAVKPTPSVAVPQQSVSFADGAETQIQVIGRHDPCIIPRAIPAVEAVAAVAVYDALLGSMIAGRGA